MTSKARGTKAVKERRNRKKIKDKTLELLKKERKKKARTFSEKKRKIKKSKPWTLKIMIK